MTEICQDVTKDSLFGNALCCRQPRNGFRFSLDAVLLAHFFRPRARDTILDLAAGCGVVSLIIAYRWPGIRLTALELRPEMAELCRINATANGFGDRIQTIAGDLRRIKDLVGPGSFSWVLCNPPYRKVDAGRVNPDIGRARARHELTADLPAVLRGAAYALKNRGRVALVYPALRLSFLFTTLRDQGLEPKRLQMVHGHPGGPGKLVLVEAVKGGGEQLTILPPFYIHQTPGGGYSAEMAACYQP
ncbi:MAG: methyltransferase [Desulfobacterales bacterium]|nr:methyltransferase [Desulfobacterales bacterium]